MASVVFPLFCNMEDCAVSSSFLINGNCNVQQSIKYQTVCFVKLALACFSALIPLNLIFACYENKIWCRLFFKISNLRIPVVFFTLKLSRIGVHETKHLNERECHLSESIKSIKEEKSTDRFIWCKTSE